MNKKNNSDNSNLLDNFIEGYSNIQKKNLYKFLKFHRKLITKTQMPYAREFATIDYLTDKSLIGFGYSEAESFLKKLLDEKILKYEQHGAFPGTTITSKGFNLLKKLKEKYELNLDESDKKKNLIKKETSKKNKNENNFKKQNLNQMHIWGKTQDRAKKKLSDIQITNDLVYRFLKFQGKIIKNNRTPYLRQIVAEDFLNDMENLSFKQTAEFLDIMIEEGITEFNQKGAFPGITITEKGEIYLKYLSYKFKKKKKKKAIHR